MACRPAAARDVVKRGQEVWVKILAIPGESLTLSIKNLNRSDITSWVGSIFTCRPAAARDVVKRGQEVWVKVVASSRKHLTPSMKKLNRSDISL